MPFAQVWESENANKKALVANLIQYIHPFIFGLMVCLFEAASSHNLFPSVREMTEKTAQQDKLKGTLLNVFFLALKSKYNSLE